MSFKVWFAAFIALMLVGTAAADNKTSDIRKEIDRKLNEQYDRGNRWAILVGINKFEKLDKLSFCVADVKLIGKALVSSCGYSAERILMLTDDQADVNLRPTKANLQKQILATLRKVEKNDTVLISFATHGSNLDGESYMCPIDFDPGNPKLTGLRIDEIRTMLHDCKAAQKILLLDACHSGRSKAAASAGVNFDALARAFRHSHGLITFSGCRESEVSAESKGNGVFTRCLVRGLLGGADFDRNGIVDSDELYNFILVEVDATVKKNDPKAQQTPVRIIGDDVVGVFALSRPGKNPMALQVPILKDEPPAPKPGDTLTNSIGMKLVFVAPNLVQVGSPKTEYQRDDNEVLQAVKLTMPIYMGVSEVTQAEYEKIMGKNPSYFSSKGGGSDAVQGMDTSRFPVEQVSWAEAMAFCEKLSNLPAEKKARRLYRLPTEVEWEAACRADPRNERQSVFNLGDRLSPKDANINGERPYLDSEEAPSLNRTARVGSFVPNLYGLYDMHGNVAEWCFDWYTRFPFRDFRMYVENKGGIDSLKVMINNGDILLPRDPMGPKEGTTRVTRGGDYIGEVHFARSACRRSLMPDRRFRGQGFRVVCIVVPEPEKD